MKHSLFVTLLCIVTSSGAFGQASTFTTGPWNLESLRQPPKITWIDKGPIISSLYYQGEPYQGKPTRVFAYLGKPSTSNRKSPAMVLVHGGGGTAFKEWAELWAARGYVALAMDLAGHGAERKRLPDGGPNQDDKSRFAADAVNDYWSYHAVAAVIRGVSVLTGLPEVDSNRIGVTGISWGGYLTCLVSGLDDRLKVAVPVYGCGFIHENSVWIPTFQKMSNERRKLWVENFEPSRYLGQAKMPMLFVNGTNDFAYPLDSYQKSYHLVKDRNLCVTVRMPHSHPAGWNPVEIGLFVDQHLRGGTPLPRFENAKCDGRRVVAGFQSPTAITKAGFHFTNDTGPWQKRVWQSREAKVAGNAAEAILPEARPIVFFLTITDDRGVTVSTEHQSLGKP